MRSIAILIVLFLVALAGQGQNLTAASNAMLQVYMKDADGADVVLNSNLLVVQYDGLHMEGELDLGTLTTDNAKMKALLDSASVRTITFSSDLPPGQFQFTNTVNYQFTSEVELNAGNSQCRFYLNYEVSNRKNDDINNFAITCTGSLSLTADLGFSQSSFVEDKISFQFFQTVRVVN